MKKTIYYWAPCLDRVGTEKSASNSAISLAKYSKEYDITVLNVFGEWNQFKKIFLDNNVNFINLGPDIYRFLPKRGFLKSRLSYLFIIFLNILPLFLLLRKNKPDYLIAHLITSLPIVLFRLFNFKTKLILRISGYPKLNFFRKNLWKFFSTSIYKITCPTKELLYELKKKKIFERKKIFFLQDAILNLKEFRLKKNEFPYNLPSKNIENYFLSIGRFSLQKNYSYLIDEFKKFKDKNLNSNIKLLIIGDGEEKENIIKKIHKLKIHENVVILNRTDNVYKYMIKASALILPSLWEEVGFVIVEAALSNTFIISSNCPNGPTEFLNNGEGGLIFEKNSPGALFKKLDQFKNHSIDKKKCKLITKKNSMKYTMFRHQITFRKILTNEN